MKNYLKSTGNYTAKHVGQVNFCKFWLLAWDATATKKSQATTEVVEQCLLFS
jgi:hypothetical protein